MSKFVVVNREAMPVKALSSLLSGRERDEVATFKGARLDRTVMSRVLVKYLTVNEDAPAFSELKADHIDAMPREALASVEALSGPAGKRRTAKVVRAGQTQSHAVSSAHCGKYTAAARGRGRLGIDLERIAPRRPEFYRQMFSDAEREWVESIHAKAAASTDAAFTFLWGVKEAFLKASNWPGLTVWSFSQWSVRVGDEVVSILQPEPATNAATARGSIASAGMTQAFAISARRVGDMMLVTVQYEDVNGETGRELL
ncbi:MAG TPA: 4'-phosphopantetheinyl transferase superfamily protein [Vicinamibacterales bacterium]